MATPPPQTITRLLEAVRDGDQSAFEALFPLIYEELRALAHHKRKEWHGDYTLNSTALVHEAYLKLAEQSRVDVTSRGHLFAMVAKTMRHILINYAERRRALKRGGDVEKLSLEEQKLSEPGQALLEGAFALTDERADTVLALDEALKKLARQGERGQRQSRIVECKFFADMTNEETAAALGISRETVKRGWTMARAWLYRELRLDLGP